MSTRPYKKLSELQLLENYRLAFQNAEDQVEIKNELAEYGYDTEKMREGKALYDTALALFNQNKQETEEEKQAYAKFSSLYSEVATLYKKHRKVIKVILLKNEELASAFRVKKAEAQAYLQWMEDAQIFYNEIKKESAVKERITLFKITDAIANEQLAKLEEVKILRGKYEKEKGESQQATKNKDAAFATISEWMREFYAVAKIALEDKPQLLESIGKHLKG